MANLSQEEVEKVAKLARLKVTSEEIASYQKELSKILDAFQSLSKIPIPEQLKGDHRSAISADVSEQTEASSRMRSDTVQNSLATEDFIQQAPSREGSFVRVPAVLDRST